MANHPPPKTSPLVAAISGPLTGGPAGVSEAPPPPTDDFQASWRAFTQSIGVSAPGHLNRAARAIHGMQGLRR